MSAHEEEYVARLESLLAGLQRDAAESQRELVESQQQRAEAARNGELGRDWQDVQRRIDAGQATLNGVFSGEDDSPAARRLLDLSQQNISRMAEEMPIELQEEVAETQAEIALLGRGGIAPTTPIVPPDPDDPLAPPAPPTDGPGPA